MADVLRALAAGGSRGSKLATIICDLVVQGAELGELEPYEIEDPTRRGDPHAPRIKFRGFRREWLDCLSSVLETDALESMSAARIVELLLHGDFAQLVSSLSLESNYE